MPMQLRRVRLSARPRVAVSRDFLARAARRLGASTPPARPQSPVAAGLKEVLPNTDPVYHEVLISMYEISSVPSLYGFMRVLQCI